jgi:hypothetical protein
MTSSFCSCAWWSECCSPAVGLQKCSGKETLSAGDRRTKGVPAISDVLAAPRRWRKMMRRAALALMLMSVAAPARAADRLDEVRRTFSIDGKPIPPRIFADFGDATLSDSRPIVAGIDALAGMDSNRWFGAITKKGAWFEKNTELFDARNVGESISYEYIGATRNNLLVVLTAYSGGGSGVFYALNILDAAWASAFDDDGTTYQRLDLKLLRHVALGDRWQGEIKISANSIHVATSGALPGQDMKSKDLEARRP